jgi:cytochrome P450
MIISQLFAAVIGHWYLLIVFALAFCVAFGKYRRGLNKFPGPFWASVSDLWQVITAIRGYQKHPYIQLHQKYGDIVRIAPNKLSFADPAAIRDVLGVGKYFDKSGFYFVSAPTIRGHPTPSLFSTVDKDYHDRIKRAVNSAFSVTSLVHYEPYVDRVIAVFVMQMKARFADRSDGSYFDLSTWLHYYSLDVIGEIVYGQQYGFLKKGKDVDNMIRDTQDMMTYAYWVCL